VIFKVRFMKEAYTNLRSTQEVPEPLIERDWPHHESSSRSLSAGDIGKEAIWAGSGSLKVDVSMERGSQVAPRGTPMLH
jgi:hypothetical protein